MRFGVFSRVAFFASVSLIYLVRVSEGAAIVVGAHPLQPNLAGQTITILVTGGDAIQGVNFNAQIADGGPAAGGTINGPSITKADLLVGTIFSANHNPPGFPGSYPQLAIQTMTTVSGTVSAAGTLATLTLSTVGFNSGTWALNLKNTLNGPTDFISVPLTITDGSISIVPEPGSVGLMLSCGMLMARRRG